MADSQAFKRIKQTSQEMMNIREDNYGYKQAFLNKVSFLQSQEIPQDASFLESLYTEGMEAYFRHHELCEKVFDMIHMAAQKGHKNSMYAFAMIVFICTDTRRTGFFVAKEFEEALGYLRFLRNHKCVLKCRNEVAEFVGWLKLNMRSDLVITPRERLCRNIPCTNTWRLRIGSWCFMDEDDDENDPNMCENCRWDHEIEEFFKMI